MNFPISRFENIETPFYFYDLSLLQQTLNELKKAEEAHPRFHVHYAIKANANPRILQLIAAKGFGADCVSGGEVQAALNAGFPADKIVFAGVGKSDKEISLSLKAGISCFNVESTPELEVINTIAASLGVTARVALRVNPNIDAHTHAKITTGLNENKFGIPAEDLVKVIAFVKTLNNLELVGVHYHIGSQITEPEPFRHLCEHINEWQEKLRAEGISLPGINVGGGLGIDYVTPDANPVPPFADHLDLFARHLNLREDQELHFELGRSVVAQCGSLISRVLYVKEGHTKKFLIVDAGFTDLIRPALYDAHHFTQNISATDQTATTTYDVVGPIFECSDVFSENEHLPLSHRGDLIAFRSAGAYGEVMASTYNCRTLPAAVFSEE